MYSISNIILVFCSRRSLFYPKLIKSTSPIYLSGMGGAKETVTSSMCMVRYSIVITVNIIILITNILTFFIFITITITFYICIIIIINHHHLAHHALHRQPLQVCSTSPMTGWYRDGKCRFERMIMIMIMIMIIIMAIMIMTGCYRDGKCRFVFKKRLL